MRIEILVSNIVKQNDIEAVVNSANANLRLGSGVAGAIHAAAGPELEAYCEPIAPLELGQAVITPGFNLPNKWVIHARAGSMITYDNALEILEECLNSVFRVALQNNIKSIAMPAVGTGVFKIPTRDCAAITAKVIKQNIDSPLNLIRICVSSVDAQKEFQSAFAKHQLD